MITSEDTFIGNNFSALHFPYKTLISFIFYAKFDFFRTLLPFLLGLIRINSSYSFLACARTTLRIGSNSLFFFNAFYDVYFLPDVLFAISKKKEKAFIRIVRFCDERCLVYCNTEREYYRQTERQYSV